MKKILILGLLFLVSCKTPQQTTQTSTALIKKTVSVQSSTCPENGNCTLELIPNKTIEFKTDEFGNSYPVITFGETTILKYTFIKKPVSDTEDSNYTEIIYAELPKDFSEISLVNEQLSNVKLHFGRLCFCKGENGYFIVKNGAFNIKKEGENSLKIDIAFTVKKVPQLISEIHETISLKSNVTN